MNNIVNHPFDELEFRNYAWCSDLYSDLLEAEIELIVEGARAPAKWQRELFDEFHKNEADFKSVLFGAIFDYYQRVAPEYRDQLSGENESVLPNITHHDEIKKLGTKIYAYNKSQNENAFGSDAFERR